MFDSAGSVLSVPRRSTEIGERHLVWLLWFAMRHGKEHRHSEMRVWSFSHVGVDLKVEVRPEGECQKVQATGRRWSLEFVQAEDAFQIKQIKQPTCFWRDLTVLRLCDESPLPH